MSQGIIRVAVEGVDLRGPGLANWTQSRPILAGQEPYRMEPTVLEPSAWLSPAERRRAILSVRLVLGVAKGAVEQSGHDPKLLPAIFASSGADGETNTAILSALATPGREVSPTRFHNSVHNAPSGYWGIAVQSRQEIISLSAYDASFAAGLLEACVQAVAGNRPILLVAYDLPYPEPLNSARRISESFGVAFVLSPMPSNRALAEIRLRMTGAPADEARQCTDPGLDDLRLGNPAARSLPLLALLAARSTGQLYFNYNSDGLEVTVAPC